MIDIAMKSSNDLLNVSKDFKEITKQVQAKTKAPLIWKIKNKVIQSSLLQSKICIKLFKCNNCSRNRNPSLTSNTTDEDIDAIIEQHRRATLHEINRKDNNEEIEEIDQNLFVTVTWMN